MHPRIKCFSLPVRRRDGPRLRALLDRAHGRHLLPPQHLHRYIAELDCRYNQRIALGVNDFARAGVTLRGISDRLITYRGSREELLIV